MLGLTLSSQLSDRSSALFRHLAKGCNGENKLGSMAVCAYDTAWVAMVRRASGEYAFPECFQALLDMQDDSGGWGRGGSQIDAILNTMAGLLALKTRVTDVQAEIEDLSKRIERGVRFMNGCLQVWNVETTDHVGFEILVPTHIRLLAEQGLIFKFPGEDLLSKMNEKKLAKFRPEMLYSPLTTTLTHSLEAFVGQIDFDRIKHHLVHGSLMGSPSSSAAYLMYASEWDESTERFIRETIAEGEGQGSGAVPSAFPITIFEITWVVSTLLMNGVNLQEIDAADKDAVALFLEAEFKAGNGTLGFVPGFMVDADDTAKTITSLRLLGRDADPTGMLQTFSNKDHFLTYKGERNPSFSANCNILVALLHLEEPSKYAAQIEMALVFLHKLHSTGGLSDKWNVCLLYAQMLFAEALAMTLDLVSKGELQGLSEETLASARISLFDIVVSTLSAQEENGSWHNGSLEITAYAAIALAAGSNSPLVATIRSQLESGVTKARSFLEAAMDRWDQPETIWVEKVSYGSPILSQAYCLAAMTAKTFQGPPASAKEVAGLAEMKQMAKFYQRLPLFSKEPTWRIEASLAQANLWYPRLVSQRHLVFPRDDMEEDKYLRYIPATWTLSNNLNNGVISTEVMWEMMVLSMLNYQADEFFETAIEEHLMDQLPAIRKIIHELCEDPATAKKRPFGEMENGASNNGAEVNGHSAGLSNGAVKGECNGHSNGECNGTSNGDSISASPASTKYTLAYVRAVLAAYTTHILTHPRVLTSPLSTRAALASELRTFMLAHLDQAADNARFRAQPNIHPSLTTPFATPRSGYFGWVRSTSADHTSCPFSFRFYCCLVANPGCSLFTGVRQLYVGEDMCRHLATMCRQYNDFGSIARDRAERNLNSVNWPEFGAATGGPGQGKGGKSEEEIKADLFWVAEYERERCMDALKRLGEGEKGAGVRGDVMGLLKAFVDVTDSYGQIYVARDIASRMK